ncbi:MAG: hypothetical protein HF973_19265 [Chloroflexi bacterium]|nr:hypothetical protein [Chloroflexota bacterium]
MEIGEHVEYGLYLRDGALARGCGTAVARWQVEGGVVETAVGPWTMAQARQFFLALQEMFQAYNRVLWQAFPYCRQCGGGCCVVGASDMRLLDGVALALLAEPFPALSAQVTNRPGICIYLVDNRCAWPSTWRPLKCAAFYCLGSGQWELDARDERYGRITHRLAGALDEYLPEVLRPYAAALREALPDPIAFADLLDTAVDEIFTQALAARFPDLSPAVEPQTDPAAEILAQIAKLSEQVWQMSGDTAQYLADLEMLEWIVLGRPGNGMKLLVEMDGRYADKSHNQPMRQLIRAIRSSTSQRS